MRSPAQRIVPGPVVASRAVAATARNVIQKSQRFFEACMSACAATAGIAIMLRRFEAATITVQASVAHGASPATTATKYAL